MSNLGHVPSQRAVVAAAGEVQVAADRCPPAALGILKDERLVDDEALARTAGLRRAPRAIAAEVHPLDQRPAAADGDGVDGRVLVLRVEIAVDGQIADDDVLVLSWNARLAMILK